MATAGSRSRVLVVDDEENLRELVRRLLGSAGYSVRTARDGGEGLRSFFSWKPDLVVLDIRMPKMNGWEMLERIREMSDTPVIMVSALGQEDEKVRGLRGGADDYVPKPFGQAELLARVEAVLRRAGESSKAEDVYADGVLHMDFRRHRISVKGRQAELSPLEFRVLGALVRAANVVLSPERLLNLCWDEKAAGPANVRLYISHLRRKLEEDPQRPKLIQTVREFGYRYCPPQDD